MADPQNTNTMRSLIRWTAFIGLVILLLYFGLLIAATILASTHSEYANLASSALLVIQPVGGQAWAFARPLLQLLIVIILIDWVFQRLGIQIRGGVQSFKWDVQAIIAIIVIAAYAVAELGGIGTGLKDIALVVVGFYFGKQRRSYEVDPQTGKIRVFEEHDNTVHDAKLESQSTKATETA
jgi:hypothetical protein